MEISKNYYCVIMAGGIGARFWPMSRSSHPKQFIDILGTGETLIQQTYNRFAKIIRPENIYVVTNEVYKALIQEQIPEMTDEQILCEPSRKNTAPCIAYANFRIYKKNPEAVIVVAPSDHIIMKEDIFLQNITTTLEAASKHDWLLTLGIRPSRPDTGYGYIQFTEDFTYEKDPHLKRVKTFTEKPNLDIAISFLKSGDFLWNSGIFIWSLKSIMKAFEAYLPDVEQLFKNGLPKYGTPEEKEYIAEAYTVCESISIDYGIMENAGNVYVLSVDFGWSDLGTWGSLYENRFKDMKGNALVGKNTMLYDTKNCIVNMPDDKVVVLQGLEEYIVVESDGVLLVCKKADEQQIRQFVNDVLMEKGEKYV